jgi:hypothetical protein
MPSAWPPPLPERGKEHDDSPRSRAVHASSAHKAYPMSGSDVMCAEALESRGIHAAMLIGVASAVLMALMVLVALGRLPAHLALGWDDQTPALGAAALHAAVLVVCLCNHLSPFHSGSARRKYGGAFLLSLVVGSALMPAAEAVSLQLDAIVDETLGDASTWVQQSQQLSSLTSYRQAVDNQTHNKRLKSIAEGARKEASGRSGARRNLLQWPPGVSDADQSPTMDPQFLDEEKRLKIASKKMQAKLERCACFIRASPENEISEVAS